MKNTYTITLLLLFSFFWGTIATAQIKAIQAKIPAVSESQLFIDYKKGQLVQLGIQKEKLLNAIKKGDKMAESQLKELVEQEKTMEQAIKNSQLIDKNLLTFKKIGPIGPCPPKIDGKCGNGFLQNLIVPGVLIKITGQVTLNNKEIGFLSPEPFYRDLKDNYMVYSFNLNKNYTGTAIIKIERTYSDGSKEAYESTVALVN